MTVEKFTRHPLDVLMRELGPDGLARFLRPVRSGTGDYTRDREQWHKDLRLDEFLTLFASIARTRVAARSRLTALVRNPSNPLACARVLKVTTSAAKSFRRRAARGIH